MSYDVLVIGAGLAGCSAALQLARRDHDVLLVDKATFPRHKLCGEFLSPEAQTSFHQLGVLDTVLDVGAQPIERAQLTASNGTTTTHPLPDTALGLSRYRLDSLLFRAARAAGAEGRLGTRVTDVRGSLDEGFTVAAGSESIDTRVVLGAYGRRGRLDRTLNRPFLKQTTPYVAFKAHFASPPASGEACMIELHSTPGGYCGISPIEDERTNVCWIGRTKALQEAGGTPESMLTHTLRQNPVLDERLQGLTRLSDEFEAVSQIPLMSKRCVVDDVFLIGDSAGMIAPLCGDGMAMALQAADLASPLASEFLGGHRSAESFRAAYRQAWRRAFGRRMRLGRWVHSAAVQPLVSDLLVQSCRVVPPLARWLIHATRGSSKSESTTRITGQPPAEAGR